MNLETLTIEELKELQTKITGEFTKRENLHRKELQEKFVALIEEMEKIGMYFTYYDEDYTTLRFRGINDYEIILEEDF